MNKVFPEPIQNLPQVDMPLNGAMAFLSQAQDHQVIFGEFSEDSDLPEHSHAAQFGVVIEGRIDFTIDGETKTYGKGDYYFIPADKPHSGKLHAPYADVTFYGQRDRFSPKP